MKANGFVILASIHAAMISKIADITNRINDCLNFGPFFLQDIFIVSVVDILSKLYNGSKILA